MLSAVRFKIARLLLLSSLTALVLLSALLASPVFAGECTVIGSCG